MKASDFIVSFLQSKGVDCVFGYIGGMITHLVDSLANSGGVKFVQTYHEQTAAIAAEGYALGKGVLGCAISTSGPGATNMMTGIADAYFDSIPVLYITGQVNSYEYKYDKPVRQQGFQETDIINVAKPITKYAALIDDASQLRYELEKAVHMAMSGRKGPVLLDITMDVQRTDIEPDTLIGFTPNEEISYAKIPIDEIRQLVSKANRPMVLLGGGCLNKSQQPILETFLHDNQLPVVTSLKGRGGIDETYSYYIGMVGSYGNRCANIAISQADLLIVLGSRLDTRQTGAKIDTFLKKGKIVHVDIDSNELTCHRIKGQLNVNASIVDFLKALQSVKFNTNEVWLNYVKRTKEKYNQNREIERFVENKAPYRFVQFLNSITREGDVVTTDVGQNQMWAAQTINLKSGMKFLTSGGLAPMGYSLPTAIGLAFAHPDRTIYALCGDGGFHMSVQSLMLISQYHLNIKVIVMNNSALGMITQFQHLYFEDRMAGTTANGGYLVPDIQLLAESYGLKYGLVTEANLQDEDKVKQTVSASNLIEVRIDGLTTVSPKLEYNKPIECPIPLLDEGEMKEALFGD